MTLSANQFRTLLAHLESSVGKHLNTLEDYLKRIESQNKAIIVQLHNHSVNSEQLTLRVHQLTQILAELLMAPDNQSEAAAVLRDFLIQLKNKK